MFASFIAGFAPLSYLLAPELLSACSPLKLFLYYLLLSLVAVSLYSGIPKVRSQLDTYQELIVAKRISDIEKIVGEFVRGRVS